MSSIAAAFAASFSTNDSMAAVYNCWACSPIREMMPRNLGSSVVAIDAPRRLADVAHQVGRSLDVGDHLHQRDHLAKVGGHRRLQREDPVAVLLEVERAGVDLVVTLDDVVGALEVAVEQHRGRSRDQLGDGCGEAHQLGACVLEIVVEALAKFVHQQSCNVITRAFRSMDVSHRLETVVGK